MSERSRVGDVLAKPRTAAAVLLAGLAFAGCGVTKSAETTPIATCGDHDYSMAESSHPNETVSEAVATAKHDILTLQQRALRAGGSIDLPRYSAEYATTEISASPDNLTLNFARQSDLGIAIDHIDFPIKDHSAQVSEGALMCFNDNNRLTVNGTFTSLRAYVHETAALR